MKLTILGYNSAVPTVRFNPSAQLLETYNRYFLIDCGEGTQVQLRKAKAKFSRINNIFISHLHGDHVFGLIGLLSSFQLLGRTTPMNIYGPKGIKEFVEIQFKLTESFNNFKINFIELTSKNPELIYEDDKIWVYTIPLNHRIYTNGFLFKEKPKLRKLNMEEIGKIQEIKICDYYNLKLGKDFKTEEGVIISNSKLTLSSPHSYSYAYCSDTLYNQDIVSQIKNVDVLYHESTFLEELKALAYKTQHTTALQAADIAKKANVKYLILGHFSNRYTDVSVFKNEAKKIFQNSLLPEELKVMDFEKLIK